MNQQIDPQAFADAVADVVEQMRWDARISSVRKLADAAEMTHTYLGARLNKKVPLDVADIARLANVFRVEPDELIDRAIAKLSEIADISQAASTETTFDRGDLEE